MDLDTAAMMFLAIAFFSVCDLYRSIAIVPGISAGIRRQCTNRQSDTLASWQKVKPAGWQPPMMMVMVMVMMTVCRQCTDSVPTVYRRQQQCTDGSSRGSTPARLA